MVEGTKKKKKFGVGYNTLVDTVFKWHFYILCSSPVGSFFTELFSTCMKNWYLSLCPSLHALVTNLESASVLQVNDAVLAGDNTLVSCSSDTTLKVCWPYYCWFCNLNILFGLLTDSFIYFLSFYLFVIELHQTWDCLSDGTCTRTLRQHSDYVTCLAAAEKNVIFLSNFWSNKLTAWMNCPCRFIPAV